MLLVCMTTRFIDQGDVFVKLHKKLFDQSFKCHQWTQAVHWLGNQVYSKLPTLMCKLKVTKSKSKLRSKIKIWKSKMKMKHEINTDAAAAGAAASAAAHA